MSKVAPEGSIGKSDKDTKPKKTLRSPLKIYLDYKARLKIEEEARLWKREEVMKEDLERFLMELEERLNWVTYELEVPLYQICTHQMPFHTFIISLINTYIYITSFNFIHIYNLTVVIYV